MKVSASYPSPKTHNLKLVELKRGWGVFTEVIGSMILEAVLGYHSMEAVKKKKKKEVPLLERNDYY